MLWLLIHAYGGHLFCEEKPWTFGYCLFCGWDGGTNIFC